ncbi:MAG: glycine--tRNA ligase [Thermoplasmata archaeon]
MLSKKLFDLAKRRGIFWGSFEIYGGFSGFYDYGPIGALVKDNIISVWKDYYVNREGLAFIDTPNISPEEVFRASGHLKEFTDYISYCKDCKTAFRVDELLKEKVPDFVIKSNEDIITGIEKFNIKCTVCGGELTRPEKFNLMFETKVGPGNFKSGYLRPETAQGIFVNFNNIYRYFREELPFGVAQIGKGFRNEIAPRQGLIRQREFNMAEVELFFDPKNKKWKKFDTIKDLNVRIISKNEQDITGPLKDGVDNKIISSEAIAYFIGLTHLFLIDIGIPANKIRFRQHTDTELAHYAIDCWDCEIESSYGWIECVGIADRGTYDLTQHELESGKDLKVTIRYETPITQNIKKYKPIEKVLGPIFKDKAKLIAKEIEAHKVTEEKDLKVQVNGEEIVVPKEAYTIIEKVEKISSEKIVPNVIEPSYGIDRILYSLLENSYYEREDSEFRVLRLTPKIAPIKVSVFPLMSKDGLDIEAQKIHDLLVNNHFKAYYDDSGSIGKRYARADEIGIPFNITVDYQTLSDQTVTLRERDSTKQVRLNISDIIVNLSKLIDGTLKFEVL